MKTDFPKTVQETIIWLQESLNRPPLPECPIQAATDGKEPKAPHFIDGKFIKSLQWKHFQCIMPPQEAITKWFCDPRMGIGTLGGFNGKHWLCWIDFDSKDFESQKECDRKVAEWESQYPLTKEMPKFRSPSGGYRYLVALSVEPENFKSNSAFSLASDGSHHCGELLTKNGGHTLLPPTIGLNGKAYAWVRWFEYPPVISCPGDVGLYPLQQKKAKETKVSVPREHNSEFQNVLEEIQSHHTLESAYNWNGHNFKEVKGEAKLKGNCPWHDSSSGTAFYCERVNGKLLFNCPVCGGGNLYDYRNSLSLPNIVKAEGKDFINVVKELGSEVNVDTSALEIKNSAESNQKYTDNVVQLRTNTTTNNNLHEKIEVIANLNLSEADLNIKFAQLASESKINVGHIEKIYQAKVKENEQKDSLLANYNQLIFLQNTEQESIDIAEILSPTLAKPIKDLAAEMSLREEAYLTTLLCTASSLMAVGTEVLLYEKTDFTVKPNLFGAIIAAPSQRKSPVINAMAKKPLSILKEKEKEKHEQELAEYNQKIALYKKLKPEEQNEKFPEGEPKKPAYRSLHFANGTIEGITSQVSGYSEKIPLLCAEELASVYKNTNVYRGGKGSDEEAYLSFYDGDGFDILRASGVKSISSLPLSMIGGIQPQVWEKLLKGCNDDNGFWARFISVTQPVVACKLSENDTGSLDITPMLAKVYSNIDSLTPITYKLEKDAKIDFIRTYNKLELLRVKETTPGMAAYWGKVAGRIGKLALNIHIINAAFEGKLPEKYITLETIKAATKLAYFYANQVQSSYIKFSDSDGIVPNFDRILKIAEKKEWITATDVNANKKGKYRTPTSDIKSWFSQLEQLGKGETKFEKGILRFRAFPKSEMGTMGNEMGNEMGTVPIPENLTEQGNPNEMGKMGKMGTVSKELEKEENNQGDEEDKNGQENSSSKKVPIVPILPISSGNPDPEQLSRMGTGMGTSDEMGTFFQLDDEVEVVAAGKYFQKRGTITHLYSHTEFFVQFPPSANCNTHGTIFKVSEVEKTKQNKEEAA
jgi:Protein of unknown function (DUF3987)/Bifunctional DNA primase/polymerase, N-terminal